MPHEAMGGSRSWIWIVVLIVLILVAVPAGWWLRGVMTEESVPALAGPLPRDEEPGTEPIEHAADGLEADATAEDELETGAEIADLVRWPGTQQLPADACAEIERSLEALCRREAASNGADPCQVLVRAAVDLAENPPVASGEMHDKEDILQNAHHFFRVLGRERIRQVRDALTEPRPELEREALTLYRWAASREACGGPGSDRLDLAALNDYAGFLLTTLGGQAYLRRRSPSTEALASFYALLTVDRAIAAGREPHGTNPRPFLRRTRQLIESQPLVHRGAYLDALERLEARWSS
jgi:hypothetical protein